MNKRIATAAALAGSLLLAPAALAAPGEPAGSGYGVETVADDALDHGQPEEDKGHGEDDHDHDGDGRPDHDPDDHGKDSDEKPKPKPKPGDGS